jgi:flagellar biosynthesis protein FlhB
MLVKAANVLGWVLLVWGVLGFVPGITTDGQLLGMFSVNLAHNVLNIVIGLAALYAAKQGESQSQMMFKTVGVIYAVVAILGFVTGDAPVLGFIANNMADTWLHVVIAVVVLWLGFGSMKGKSMQTA